MIIASWNINSVRARIDLLSGWLNKVKPDILFLQEIKCQNDSFPLMELKALGYEARVVGQKAYNGVAILSRETPQNPIEALPTLPKDHETAAEARFVQIELNGAVFINIYVPNGNPVDGPRFELKLAWLEALKDHMAALIEREIPVFIGGDFNIIPEERDVFDPKAWQNDALFRPETRALWRRMKALGYEDALRAFHPYQEELYSFWDYQGGAWQRNLGLRIDHFLLSPEALDRTQKVWIDKEPRGLEKPSDHTPILLETF